MSAVQINFPLPVLPAGWAADKDFKATGTLSAPTPRNVEPVGPHFLAHARRKRHQRTFSEDDRIQAEKAAKKVEDEDDGEISEPEDPLMLQREAKDWKAQDHYAVLGISRYRWRATEEQIKRAHRKKVLKHHPDKKAAAGKAQDDNFFKCIQKATEVLLDPTKRRQFDSVDEAADVEPPTKKEAQKGNFYKLWGKVFESEARFSKIQPVPMLGDEKSTKEEVENFYNFWYNFDSWRSFEYQDEDVPDDNESRDQKRHIEKKNLNARKKKKTEDTARLRHLVDDCLATDERIKKFRQEEYAQKHKKRLEKEAEAKRQAEEAQKKKEEEARQAAEKEAAAKADKEAAKKAKEAAKNAAKKNKRVIRNAVKDANYFATGGDASASQIDAVLNQTDALITKLDADDLAAMVAKLNGKKDAAEIKQVYAEEVQRLVGAGKAKEDDFKALA
ncbi:Heat shock protein DnaJ [Lasiodiplodia theobromae]|uniref:Zuotin n=2 Tax=Lasiodiplodia TaxID=66739 RepID=A0A5N5DGW6_9PEZI|nr:Ribosome associated chaperone [Lasiodiplodia theobromae]KAB2577079.1 Zuotin [Lasiodiplodia theobromae]KAF4543766.1 Ribosome associated chaperone [Lasiodiplodia theobromae]KAF9631504.1 Heat shock protein DnaJ [Lasiodiplodia theobromae]KAK0662344.1 Zuotin [Lasiodiplodia hormozganensis]